jgi:hypothetical protein
MTQLNKTNIFINNIISKIQKTFLQNTKIIIFLFVLLVVFAIIFFSYLQYQNNISKKFSALLHQAIVLQETNPLEAKEKIIDIYQNKKTPNNIKQIAGLRYASAIIDNKKKEAIEIYQQLIKCFSCDLYLQELPKLLLAKTLISQESSPENIKNISEQLQKLESSSRLFRYHIAEQRGYFAITQNNLAEAYQIFESIAKNPDTEKNLKNRAENLLSFIINKGYQPKSS